MEKKNLSQMTPQELGQLFPIKLSEPKECWVSLFEREGDTIGKAINVKGIRIEHIGSTAIPNLVSKPTIDILLEIPLGTDVGQVIRILNEHGYHHIPKPENPPPGMMFVKGYTPDGFKGQSYHIHLRYPNNCNEILFRDYLRTHPDTAKEYAELKKQLAISYQYDRDGYTDAKSDFVRKVMDLAGKELA